MKKSIIALLSLTCMFSALAFASCAGGGAKSVAEFNVDENMKYVEIGEAYSIPKVAAKDNKGNFVAPTITVQDPNGADVTVTNNVFRPAIVGIYTVTYTVTVGEDTQTKSFKLEVYDETEPLVDIDLQWYNITMPGSTFDISTITATDNSGEAVTPVVTVLCNDEEVDLGGGTVVTFTEKGTYKINVKAEDSSGNKENRDYVVYTHVGYEDGVFCENQFYANEVSEDFARHGEKSMKIDIFGGQPGFSYYNDSSILGELYLYGNTKAKPYKWLSYWIYFDAAGAGVNASANLLASWYDIHGIYDAYGRELTSTTNDIGDTLYEFQKNTWYRIVTDITTLDNPLDHGEVRPISECLLDYGIYFGAWDNTNGTNQFDTSVKAYIDDIHFIDIDNDDEVYDKTPVELAKEYNKGDRLACWKYADMVWAIGADTADHTAGDAILVGKDGTDLVSFNFKHGAVDGTMSAFNAYATQLIGTDSSASIDSTNKKAFANGWQIFAGNGDGFIYEIEAHETVFIDLKAQTTGVDGAEGTTGGWPAVDSGSSARIRIFVKDADGKITKFYDYEPNCKDGVDANGNPTGVELANFLLEEGCTLYYEFTFAHDDHRWVENPVYLNVYTATKKDA